MTRASSVAVAPRIPQLGAPVGHRVQALAQRGAELAATVKRQAEELAAFKAQANALTSQVSALSLQNTASQEEINAIRQRNRELAEEAERLRTIAVGVGGVATGFGLGFACGVAGPKILVCGAAGGAAALVGKQVYDKMAVKGVK